MRQLILMFFMILKKILGAYGNNKVQENLDIQ